MAGVDANRDAGDPLGHRGEVMHRDVVAVNHVGAVAAQLLCHGPDGGGPGVAFFVELDHRHAAALQFAGQGAGAIEAVDRGSMAGGALRQGEIDGQALEAAHLEVLHHLDDGSHSFNRVGHGASAVSVPDALRLPIASNGIISRHQGKLAGGGLGDQQTVERIAVQERQFLERRDMFQADGQDAGLEVARGLAEPAGHIGNPQFGLEGDLPGGDHA